MADEADAPGRAKGRLTGIFVLSPADIFGLRGQTPYELHKSMDFFLSTYHSF